MQNSKNGSGAAETSHTARNNAILVGAGLAAVAAAAAGTYFLYGSKNAKKNRAHVKAWTLKAKGDVLEKMEKLKDINEDTYKGIVDEVAARYRDLKKLDASEVMAFATELRGHWKEIAKQLKAAKPTAKKSAKSKSARKR